MKLADFSELKGLIEGIKNLLGEREIFFVRHGATELSTAGVGHGVVDTLLTEEGVKGVKKSLPVYEHLKSTGRVQHVYVSGLKRTHQTAEALGVKEEEYKPNIDFRLNEAHMGAAEGDLKNATINNEQKLALVREMPTNEKIYGGFTLHNPNPSKAAGEGLEETKLEHAIRVLSAIKEALFGKKEGGILFVSHSGSMSRIFEALGIEGEEIKNGEIYSFSKSGLSKLTTENGAVKAENIISKTFEYDPKSAEIAHAAKMDLANVKPEDFTFFRPNVDDSGRGR